MGMQDSLTKVNPICQNTKIKGSQGEDIVCDYLLSKGYVLVDRNIREKFGEIDIVARDKDILCFIEVRTRSTTNLGHPSETVTHSKQQIIRRTAEAYLVRHNLTNIAVRFDVATFVWSTSQFDYFKNAF